ncbi:MAG: class I SAM-dependent methyltransferase, partial [Deltaproteobacteria bacterium]
VAAFAAAGRSVTVVRFDGVRKRGESHNDPECRAPGEEHRHFTCSQGVDDIRATLDFLHALPEFRPSKAVLVTFSASAVEGRRATLLEGGRRLHGWVSVVGSPDLQSAMRVISGGVDYVAGLERGIRFGIQEVLGVYVDIDRTGSDAVANGLAFLDDARRELAQIDVPIRWFAGEHDAWMDLDRTIDILSRGTTENRRIIIIPTGHQLRTSREALEAFQSIAGEIGRMTLGVDLPAALPDFVDLERRQRAERNRRRRSSVDLRGFWRDYLVGRDGSVGIELMVNTSAYREFMDAQIHALRLGVGERVADLGSGTGAFALQLCERTDVPKPLVVHEFDFVRQALDRARSRFAPIDRDDGIRVQRLEASLDVRTRQLCVPARASSYDAVLASLLLGYVSDPACLLREIRRVLRPGGRLVLSNLRRDADFSRIFREGLAELRQGLFGERFSESEVEGLDGAARSML